MTRAELAKLARACFKKAEQVEEPGHTEEDARAVLQAFLDDRSCLKHREAKRVIRRIVKAPKGTQSSLSTRVCKADNTRHWAIFFMMDRLLSHSDLDSAAPRGVTFPYPTPHSAAAAVERGFRDAGISSVLTIDAVLKQYQRHFNRH